MQLGSMTTRAASPWVYWPLLPLAVLFSACQFDPLAPEAHPFILERQGVNSDGSQFADLDGDGQDEVIDHHVPSGGPAGIEAVWIRTPEGITIEQVNYRGKLLPFHFLDLNGDQRPEIFVQYIRNDSLFLNVLDARGKELLGFFVAAGQPRHEPTGPLPWDGKITRFFLRDLEADGTLELVAVVVTGFARYPRGVFVFDLPDGRLMGKTLVGTNIHAKSFFGDFDGDGKPEIALGSYATDNGAVVGGLDDAHAFFLVVTLQPHPEVVLRREMGGRQTETDLDYANYDDDAALEFLRFTVLPRQSVTLEVVEPGTWRTLRRRTLALPIETAQFVRTLDTDRDARPEILVATKEPSELALLNQQFDIIRHRKLPQFWFIDVVPDLDDDGIDEIVVVGEEVFLLNPDLSTKAVLKPEGLKRLPALDVHFATVNRRGPPEAPSLVLNEGGRIITYRLTPNRFYLFYRYGPFALWGLGLLLVGGAAIGARKLRHQYRLSRFVYPAALSHTSTELFILDEKGLVVFANTQLRDLLGLSDQIVGTRFDEALRAWPALTHVLHQALAAQPPQHAAEELALARHDRFARVAVTIDPVISPRHSYIYWLVTCDMRAEEDVATDAALWRVLAKDVLHDLKKSLWVIGSKAERLQALYPQNNANSGPGSLPAEIVALAASLQHDLAVYLRIVNLESLELVPTDVGAYVRGLQGFLARDLPPDICLRCDIAPGLPPVLLDPNQMQVVLDNLVTNAFTSIETGGTITLSGEQVHADAEETDEVQSYIVLHVQDTGRGIPAEDLPHLFDPGFTTRPYGSGLGLPLVKRIVARHGGYVRVESTVGVGAIFSVFLPVPHLSAS